MSFISYEKFGKNELFENVYGKHKLHENYLFQ